MFINSVGSFFTPFFYPSQGNRLILLVILSWFLFVGNAIMQYCNMKKKSFRSDAAERCGQVLEPSATVFIRWGTRSSSGLDRSGISITNAGCDIGDPNLIDVRQPCCSAPIGGPDRADATRLAPDAHHRLLDPRRRLVRPQRRCSRCEALPYSRGGDGDYSRYEMQAS